MEIECIHFFSYPYTSQRAQEKVLELARLLTVYCGRMTVDVVGSTEIQEAIRDGCPEEYFTLIMRRFMMRIAQRIALEHGCKCLVTGESLGQVASQTMLALGVTGAVVSLPLFTPSSAWIRRRSLPSPAVSGRWIPPFSRMRTAAPSLPQATPKTKPTPGSGGAGGGRAGCGSSHIPGLGANREGDGAL